MRYALIALSLLCILLLLRNADLKGANDIRSAGIAECTELVDRAAEAVAAAKERERRLLNELQNARR